jgi:hypothetical protein
VGPRPDRLDQRARVDRVAVRERRLRAARPEAAPGADAALPRPGRDDRGVDRPRPPRRPASSIFRNVAIEKSRQIGETWLFAAVVCWALHYHPSPGSRCTRRAARSTTAASATPSSRSSAGSATSTGGSTATARRPLGRSASGRSAATRRRSRTRRTAPSSSARARPTTPAAAHVRLRPRRRVRVRRARREGVRRARRGVPGREGAVLDVNGDGNEHARICDEKPQGWTYLRLHWSTHPVYSRGLHVAGDDPDCELCAGNRAGVEWNGPRPARAPLPRQADVAVVRRARDRQDARAGRERARHRP